MLEISGIDVFYGELQVLFNVSLKVSEGEIVCVVGSNGAGKSTLLKTISGLLHPASGKIRFDGTELNKLPPWEIAELGISLIAEGRRIFPSLTVLENLKVASYLPATKKARKESLELVFETFPRLKERASQIANSLSGGERQMLCVAMGLMCRPKLLLLDEPSQGLAPTLVEEVFTKLTGINKAYKVAILIVEQNVLEALTLANRGYVIVDGRIALEGKASELIEMEEIREHYLGI